MVAKIKSGKSLKGALFYNEQKVADGKALLLEAVGYAKEVPQLTISDKLFRLQDLAGRNQRVTTNTVHISLNFGLKEILSAEQLATIAGVYMEGIGFGAQPYLVYQHLDAGHPHIHILSTNIDRDGKRISLHDLGRTKSESTRKEIEIDFGLQRAEDAKPDEELRIEPVIYGAVHTKRAMEQVVRLVTNRYRFTSLPEFNAVLQQFNVLADRGSQSSTMRKQNGLRYWVIGPKGTKIGVPIKASALKGKPTLKLLEQRFTLNSTLRRSLKEKVRLKVDRALVGARTIREFQEYLKGENISAVIRRTDNGLIYGLTLVDNELRTVFNGSDLGKGYAAAAIASKLADTPEGKIQRSQVWEKQRPQQTVVPYAGKETLLNTLLAPTADDPATLAALRPKRKKKRRLNL
ncbi:relaxase [Mucilaginibacter limnophilus]|uniref:Relaxase n=1 Tax=Mucilaginibacter limnophilus TaxID=1932778 RepID=A0A437MLF3_9SPHI|nr:relaxase/mobilization nuclease domain-containing protein [Mucilaginibacter limnophilus]RVT98500.1 relaxase [Mucilaginibacter limnophilus]